MTSASDEQVDTIAFGIALLAVTWAQLGESQVSIADKVQGSLRASGYDCNERMLAAIATHIGEISAVGGRSR